MSDFQFPPEILHFNHPSYEPLHHSTRAVGAMRRALTPRQKHWWHVSLRVNATGLTTTPIPYKNESFEIALDLVAHRVVVNTSRGEQWATRLRGQPLSQFWKELNDALATMDIQPNAPKPDYADAPSSYDAARIENYWRALSQVDILLKQFQGELRAETSPVQFWSHHFDLAMLWFSGRLVPGQDAANEEYADEQMNFGFSVGDEKIPEPYFYVTAYPLPENFIGSPLPNGAEWHTDGWNGALLSYKKVVAAREPDALLLDFWQSVQKRGAELMT